MKKFHIRRLGIAALVFLTMMFRVSDLSAQFSSSLGALAPDNLKKPRPKPPFDMTGAWLHDQRGESLRFDPPDGFKLKPEAQKHYDAAQQAIKDGKTYRNDIGLCWPSGLPILMTRVWPLYTIQIPTAIYMIQELMNTLRVIYLDGRPHTDPEIAVRSFNGESIGHWEGETLVVDTTNFVEDHHWIHDRWGIPASDALHIVERIRMTAGGQRLEIEYTLTDSKMWEGDWKIVKHFNRVDDSDISEVECLPDVNDHMPTVRSKDNVR